PAQPHGRVSVVFHHPPALEVTQADLTHPRGEPHARRLAVPPERLGLVLLPRGPDPFHLREVTHPERAAPPRRLPVPRRGGLQVSGHALSLLRHGSEHGHGIRMAPGRRRPEVLRRPLEIRLPVRPLIKLPAQYVLFPARLFQPRVVITAGRYG